MTSRWIKRFRDHIDANIAVSQCYAVSGEFDYVLIVYATTPEAYDAWRLEELAAHPEVAKYKTSLVWKRSKFTTRVDPIG